MSSADAAFCVDVVLPIARAVARDQHPNLFHHFRDYAEEDLAQDLIVRAAAKAHADYRPGGGRSYTAWVYFVLNRKAIDLWREKGRQAGRDARCAIRRDAAYDATAELDAALAGDEGAEEAVMPGGLGDDETVEDWAGRVYRQAVRTFTGNGARSGRAWYTEAQCVTVALLMLRFSWGIADALARFEDSADLGAALRLKRAPDATWLRRCLVVARGLRVPGIE